MGGDAVESPTGRGGGERCIHDEEDGDYGYVPSASCGPVFGILDVVW